MSMKVYYIVPAPEIQRVLRHMWHDLDMQPLSLGAACPVDADVILLQSPIRYQGIPVCLDTMWKRHLVAQDKATVKLISLGFVPNTSQHPNYIDLLNLSTDWQGAFSQAKPADANWEVVDTFGLDLQDKLHRFLKGHDNRDYDSLVTAFSQINKKIDALSANIHQQKMAYAAALAQVMDEENLLNIGFSPAEIAKQYPPNLWKMFVGRLSNYKSYFQCSPIKPFFDKIDRTTAPLKPFFLSSWRDEALLPLAEQGLQEVLALLRTLQKDYAEKAKS